jgi:nitrite reductase/ring-hydroxylating ferredoxin subunit
MILGHVAGDAVLLARRGQELFAIGAECTHYHGPLAEGVLVEDTVRCPWHHACFSLRTGEALRAPALNPVLCWRVELSTGGLTRAPTSFKHLRSKLLSRTVGGTLRSRCACQHQVEADPCRDGRAVRCPNRRPRLARETDLLPLRRADMVVSWTKRRP